MTKRGLKPIKFVCKRLNKLKGLKYTIPDFSCDHIGSAMSLWLQWFKPKGPEVRFQDFHYGCIGSAMIMDHNGSKCFFHQWTATCGFYCDRTRSKYLTIAMIATSLHTYTKANPKDQKIFKNTVSRFLLESHCNSRLNWLFVWASEHLVCHLYPLRIILLG